jgi:hypothetical protein
MNTQAQKAFWRTVNTITRGRCAQATLRLMGLRGVTIAPPVVAQSDLQGRLCRPTLPRALARIKLACSYCTLEGTL